MLFLFDCIFALWLLLDEKTERHVLHLFLQLSMGEEEGSGRTSPQLALLGRKNALPIVLSLSPCEEAKEQEFSSSSI